MFRCPSCHRRVLTGQSCSQHDQFRVASEGDDDRDERYPVIAGYRVEHVLGRGGYASVFAGVAERDGAAVGIKLAHTGSQLIRDRFTREVDALRAIKPPHVPRLIEHRILDSGRPCIIMDRIAAPTLAEWLAGQVDLPELRVALDVADRVSEALQAAHACAIIHRDLKPENIFIARAPSTQVTLIDFGLAVGDIYGDASLTSTGRVVGTPEYMAPEQLRGAPDIDARADIYALGVILFELIALRPPFIGTAFEIERGHLTLRPPRLRLFASVSEPVEALILACLAKSPERRPASVSAIRSHLARCVRQLDTSGDEMVRVTDSPAPRQRNHQMVVLLCAVSPLGLQDVTACLDRTGGFVARAHGDRFICAFSGVETEDPIAAAAAAASALHDDGIEQLCLHIARVRVRVSKRGAPKVYGPAVERPDIWLPRGDWSGVALTDDFVSLAPPPTLRALSALGLADTGADHAALAAPLIGRLSVIERVDRLRRAVDADRKPCLITIIGAPGLGKTRLLDELRARVAADWDDAAIIEFDARRYASDPDELIARLYQAAVRRAPPSGVSLTQSSLPLSRAIQELARERRVALLLDDAHLAHDIVLDAIEHATLDGVTGSLVIAIAARARLDQTRAQWANRAYRHDRITLAPLDESAAIELCSRLLAPVEYPPMQALRQLAAWAHGIPAVLVDLVQTLKREGIVRQHPGKQTWYLATAALESLPPSPAQEWLTARELASWPRELAAFTQLCACLGVAVHRDEIDWVQEGLERSGDALELLDVDIGVSDLVQQGVLLRESEQRYVFVSESFQNAVYKLIPDDARRRIHANALDYWRRRVTTDNAAIWQRRARHARAAGERAEAADLYRRLARRSADAHRYVEAEPYYTAELDVRPRDDRAAYAEALWGRSQVRWRMYRLAEALHDIEAACELTRRCEDAIIGALHADLLLERAIVQDWAQDFSGAKQSVAAASRAIDALPDNPRLQARLRMSEGRVMFRDERPAECASIMTEAAELAARAGDPETVILALVLMAPALVLLGQFDDAEARFSEGIELCERAGDTLHQCVAYANRMFLWSFTGQPGHAITDLRRATELAREGGYPLVERVATFNLAELLYWIGQDHEALDLAERARRIQERFTTQYLPDDELLVARILLSMNRVEQAKTRLDELADRSPPDESAPRAWIHYRSLRLVIEPVDGPEPRDTWQDVIARARECLNGQELVEVLYWRLRSASDRDAPELRKLGTEMAELAQNWPIWQPRLRALQVGHSGLDNR